MAERVQYIYEGRPLTCTSCAYRVTFHGRTLVSCKELKWNITPWRSNGSDLGSNDVSQVFIFGTKVIL